MTGRSVLKPSFHWRLVWMMCICMREAAHREQAWHSWVVNTEKSPPRVQVFCCANSLFKSRTLTKVLENDDAIQRESVRTHRLSHTVVFFLQHCSKHTHRWTGLLLCSLASTAVFIRSTAESLCLEAWATLWLLLDTLVSCWSSTNLSILILTYIYTEYKTVGEPLY